MNKQILSILMVIGLIVAGCGFFIAKITNHVPVPTQNQIQSYGSASPDIPSPYFSYGDLRHWATKTTMYQGTTTLCAMQSPAATTTLRSATANFTFSATYANDYQLANATSAFATTTNLGKITIAANALGTLVATTTVTALTDGIVAPNTWINLKVSTSTASTTFAPIGTCAATFIEVN